MDAKFVILKMMYLLACNVFQGLFQTIMEAVFFAHLVVKNALISQTSAQVVYMIIIMSSKMKMMVLGIARTNNVIKDVQIVSLMKQY